MKKSLSQPIKGLVFLSMMVCSTLYAGTFAINPIRSTLSVAHKVDALTITNQGAEPTTIQLEVLAWSQDDQGKDVFASTKDILATPPIFTVAPNAKQVIRLGLRRPVTTNQEQTYRLFLTEVPSARKEGFTGVKVSLKMSLPIFALPQTPVSPLLQWRLHQDANGELRLAAHNTGSAHIQVANFTLAPEAADALPKQQIGEYLLPNQQRNWLIKEHKALTIGTKAHLSAQTDNGMLQADLFVEP